MTVYLATNNEHKKQEINAICPGINLISPSDEGLAFAPKETGHSFFENSLIKARALWEIVHKPVLADDSGLCVDILDGAPGIFSSRYGGKTDPQGLAGGKLSQQEQNTLLLAHADSLIPHHKDSESFRSCRYVCAMLVYLSENRFYCVQETLEAVLIDSIERARGSGGFGYDPIVYLPALGKTVAELSPDEKNKLSHRGKAAKKILQLLEI